MALSLASTCDIRPYIVIRLKILLSSSQNNLSSQSPGLSQQPLSYNIVVSIAQVLSLANVVSTDFNAKKGHCHCYWSSYYQSPISCHKLLSCKSTFSGFWRFGQWPLSHLPNFQDDYLCRVIGPRLVTSNCG